MRVVVATSMLVALALVASPSFGEDCRTILGLEVGDDCERDPGTARDIRPAPEAERALVRAIDAARARQGSPSLSAHPGAARIARAYARRMSHTARVEHNPALAQPDVRARLGSPQAVAENVGKGQDISGIHTAFMKSPGHRRNILGPFDAIGIGVVFDGRTYWAAEIFMAGGRLGPVGPGATVAPFHPAALLDLPGGLATAPLPRAEMARAVPVRGAATTPWLGVAAVVFAIAIARGARSRSVDRA